MCKLGATNNQYYYSTGAYDDGDSNYYRNGKQIEIGYKLIINKSTEE